MSETYLTPPETVKSLAAIGNDKGQMPLTKMIILGLLAGVYIAFGAHFSTTLTTGISDFIGYGLTKFVGGAAFSLGLILVVVAGAELFTGNTLMTVALLEKRINFLQMGKNWTIVYFTNFLGALLIASLIFYAGINGAGETLTPIGKTAVSIAQTKSLLPPLQIFIRAIMANWLVCLAVVMGISTRDIASKILAIMVPITAFVAMGLEHSIANMYFLPAGIFAASGTIPSLTWSAALTNIGIASLGNIIGGAIFVGCAYWYAYLKPQQSQ